MSSPDYKALKPVDWSQFIAILKSVQHPIYGPSVHEVLPMASNEGFRFARFYDAEQREFMSANDVSAAEIARRPWKAFWPPRSEEHHDIWLHCEFPEVLSWRFDTDQPFDQPWRTWLQSLLMKDEEGSCQKKYAWADQNQGISYLVPYSFSFGKNRAKPKQSNFLSTLATDGSLDDHIDGLPKIQVPDFHYLAPLELYKTEKPFFSQLPCGTRLPRTNLVESDHTVEMYDVSGNEHLFKLDEAGFQFMRLPTEISEWTDEIMHSKYLPDLAVWLKKYFNCEDVFIYNYNLRTNDRQISGLGPWRAPIFRVHCDNTPGSCAKRLEFQFPTKAKNILRGRYRYIDIWRCLNSSGVDAPLALCDYRTIEPTDLWGIDIVYPHFSEEGYEVTYNPSHRWFYKKEMSKDDVVLFKLGDNSATSAPFAPHAAFIDPSASGDLKRSSVEVRAIIIG